MVVHPLFWVFSILVSSYLLYLLASWRGKSPAYAWWGLLSFLGLLIGAFFIMVTPSSSEPRPAREPKPARAPKPIREKKPATAPPAAAASVDAASAVEAAERIVNTPRRGRDRDKGKPVRQDRFAALETLRELHDAGLLSDREFEERRRDILFKM
jgi:hypothetical protein